jgi:hypothetical protein
MIERIKHKVVFQVEADFHNGEGWKRNFVEHESPESADLMARKLRNFADVRIVRVEVTEVVVA